MNAKCPVIIRGISYVSQSAAARALSVPQSAVYKALELGRIDNVGLGRNNNNCKPITINGIRYPSRAEAARSLGMSPSIFHRWKKKQCLE